MEPAFALEEGEEHEAAKEFLGEVADGLVGLGLGFFGGFGGDAEAGAGVGGALGGEELGKEGGVMLLVAIEEFLGEFFDGEAIVDVCKFKVMPLRHDFCKAGRSGAAGFIFPE